MSETIDKPTMAIAEYSPTAAALADLRGRLADVAYDLSTGKGMEIAKKDRAEVRGLRVALEAKRVELKAPALERSRLIDAEAKALTAELVALEKPIDDQIKAEEARKEAAKAARESAEQAARAVIQERIDAIRAYLVIPAGVKAAGIYVAMQNLEATEITLDAYGDRAGEAQQVKAGTLAAMEDLHAAAVAHEAEQARLEEERAELARQRSEQEAREKAERELLAAEQKAAADKLAAERAAFEKEQAAARAEAKAREDADRARRDEEDRKAREARAAEDKRIADARAALEAEQRAIRAAEEAKAVAARKAEQDALDAAAAAERKRLDEEAATARAKEIAFLEAMKQEAIKGSRIREAGPVLLAALRAMVEAHPVPSTACKERPAYEQAIAAIKEATGEEA